MGPITDLHPALLRHMASFLTNEDLRNLRLAHPAFRAARGAQFQDAITLRDSPTSVPLRLFDANPAIVNIRPAEEAPAKELVEYLAAIARNAQIVRLENEHLTWEDIVQFDLPRVFGLTMPWRKEFASHAGFRGITSLILLGNPSGDDQDLFGVYQNLFRLQRVKKLTMDQCPYRLPVHLREHPQGPQHPPGAEEFFSRLTYLYIRDPASRIYDAPMIFPAECFGDLEFLGCDFGEVRAHDLRHNQYIYHADARRDETKNQPFPKLTKIRVDSPGFGAQGWTTIRAPKLERADVNYMGTAEKPAPPLVRIPNMPHVSHAFKLDLDVQPGTVVVVSSVMSKHDIGTRPRAEIVRVV